jgi:hypothetical protein
MRTRLSALSPPEGPREKGGSDMGENRAKDLSSKPMTAAQKLRLEKLAAM